MRTGTAGPRRAGYDMGRALLQRYPQVDAMFGGDDYGTLGFYRAAVDELAGEKSWLWPG